MVNQLRLAERIPELIPKLFRQIFTKVLSIDAEIKQDPQFNNFIIKTTPRQPSQNVQRDETCCKLDRVLSLLLEFLAAKQGQASQNFSNERNVLSSCDSPRTKPCGARSSRCRRCSGRPC